MSENEGHIPIYVPRGPTRRWSPTDKKPASLSEHRFNASSPQR
jgi:hypothetical protein